MKLTEILNVPTPISHFKRIYEKNNVKWDEVNIVGIRNENDQEDDIFNDFIGIITDDIFNMYIGTTDPGAYWTKNGGSNADNLGVAHLCLGLHKDSYMVGFHYDNEAMVQRGNVVNIWRDKNKNFVQDEKEIFHGYFGINIHRAGISTIYNTIGKWSAGCQVIQKNSDFNEFMSIIKNSNKYKQNPVAKFSYFLINEEMFYIK